MNSGVVTNFGSGGIYGDRGILRDPSAGRPHDDLAGQPG